MFFIDRYQAYAQLSELKLEPMGLLTLWVSQILLMSPYLALLLSVVFRDQEELLGTEPSSIWKMINIGLPAVAIGLVGCEVWHFISLTLEPRVMSLFYLTRAAWGFIIVLYQVILPTTVVGISFDLCVGFILIFSLFMGATGFKFSLLGTVDEIEELFDSNGCMYFQSKNLHCSCGNSLASFASAADVEQGKVDPDRVQGWILTTKFTGEALSAPPPYASEKQKIPPRSTTLEIHTGKVPDGISPAAWSSVVKAQTNYSMKLNNVVEEVKAKKNMTRIQAKSARKDIAADRKAK